MADELVAGQRWSIEQIEALAPSAAAMTAARPIATPARWRGTGADDRLLWGSFHGSGAEPYDTMVDHASVGFSCTCPSRRVPCKHALALLLLWVGDHVPAEVAPPAVAGWGGRRAPRSAVAGTAPPTETPDRSPPPEQGHTPPQDHERNEGRDERVARMRAGLDELDRWLVDRMRTGLTDPSLAQFATWDALAARLVDARAGSLANRVRRLAGVVGASPEWHERVLEEIGLLHLLAQAGRRLGTLPDALADRVATTVGWQVRQADVLAGVPETDDWIVAGRSDTREDRIEVRRHWLRATTTDRWALVLSFAAYRQSLDASLAVGTSIRADLHRYPGDALRAIVGRRHAEPTGPARPASSTVKDACDGIGRHIVAEPWLERVPAVLRAAPTTTGSWWVLTDATGSVPLARTATAGLETLLAVSAGEPVDMTVEWTPGGVVVLAIHRADGSIDIGPTADGSFVGAA